MTDHTNEVCVSTASEMTWLTQQLPRKHFTNLEVDIHDSLPPPQLRDLLIAVKRHHQGTFSLHLHDCYTNYRPCDRWLDMLRGARCQQLDVTLCLSSSDMAATALAGLPSTGELTVSLSDPLTHRLAECSGRMGELVVRVQHQACYCPSSHRPLPRDRAGRPPVLRVTDIPEGGAADAHRLIMALTGHEKTYRKLGLPQCLLRNTELTSLVQELHYAGFRTSWGGNDSHWELDEQ